MLGKLIPVMFLGLIVAASGCTTTGPGQRPEQAILSIEEVRDFIQTNQEYELFVNMRSSGYVRARIGNLTDRCGPYFKISDYWQVTIRNPLTMGNLTVWLERESMQLACMYGMGVDSPAPYIPGPQSRDITLTGFSNLEVKGDLTEVKDKQLRLVLGNPGQDRITIKRVTASFLDDLVDNKTNSGLLSQGESAEYTFDMSNSIIEDKPFWIGIDVLYDINDRSITNQKSRGSIISGIDDSRIIQCSVASFEISRRAFYVGTRVFSVTLRNTGDMDLSVQTIVRHGDSSLEEFGEPTELGTDQSETREYTGLGSKTQSITFVSDECPGAYQVVFGEDIAGL